jgi:hypothetical protein
MVCGGGMYIDSGVLMAYVKSSQPRQTEIYRGIHVGQAGRRTAVPPG